MLVARAVPAHSPADVQEDLLWTRVPKPSASLPLLSCGQYQASVLPLMGCGQYQASVLPLMGCVQHQAAGKPSFLLRQLVRRLWSGVLERLPRADPP